MGVAVWDTYVNRENGKVMHFDILVPDDLTNRERVFEFGRIYLKSKDFETKGITSKKCTFCHIGQATNEVMANIAKEGFHIIEMENCT